MSEEQKSASVRAIVLHQPAVWSLAEVSCACAVHVRYILEMVDEGVLTPTGARSGYFSGEQLYRAQRALRLQRDLHINLAGAALALQLLDEMDALRAQLRAQKHSRQSNTSA